MIVTTNAERRNAARYSIHGPVAVRGGHGSFSSEIFDISLNGALLSKPRELSFTRGDKVEVALELPSIPAVSAHAFVVHSGEERFGVEFSDMETRDFDVFSGLVLMLEQRTRASLVPIESSSSAQRDRTTDESSSSAQRDRTTDESSSSAQRDRTNNESSSSAQRDRTTDKSSSSAQRDRTTDKS